MKLVTRSLDRSRGDRVVVVALVEDDQLMLLVRRRECLIERCQRLQFIVVDIVCVHVGPRADGVEVGDQGGEPVRSDRGRTGCGPRDGEPEAILDGKLAQVILPRSEERRVGKECRYQGSEDRCREKRDVENTTSS